MRKTLLLVFIHGFKGGDDTFGTFPEHLRALISHSLPKVNVVAVQYPKFETRGELKDCVARLREWLENKVIDLEVANSTASPTLDPSVHVILMGHSMGGIVAGETLLLLANEQPIPSSVSHATGAAAPSNPSANTTVESPDGTSQPTPSAPVQDRIGFLFPHVQAVIAFDTPYLGLAPEMVAHGLEGGHKMASSAWETANELGSLFGWGTKPPTSGTLSPGATSKSIGALPAPATSAAADAAAAPRWQSWGKVAMFAGAAGAVAAGGAAALYSQREKISAGWGWATSHLLFVGDLAKAENLKRRVAAMESTVLERRLGGCGNFYTNLGKGAREGYGLTESVSGKLRTFCNLPQQVKDQNDCTTTKRGRLSWMKAVNDKAKDETSAHMSMFFPRENPGFYTLAEDARKLVCEWIDEQWYESSEGEGAGVGALPDLLSEEEIKGAGTGGEDWEGLEQREIFHDDDADVKMRDEEKENDGELEDSVLIETKSPSGSGHLRRSSASLSTSNTGTDNGPSGSTSKVPQVHMS